MAAEDWLAEDFDSDHWHFKRKRKRKCKYCKKMEWYRFSKNNKWILKDEPTNTPQHAWKQPK